MTDDRLQAIISGTTSFVSNIPKSVTRFLIKHIFSTSIDPLYFDTLCPPLHT